VASILLKVSLVDFLEDVEAVVAKKQGKAKVKPLMK